MRFIKAWGDTILGKNEINGKDLLQVRDMPGTFLIDVRNNLFYDAPTNTWKPITVI